MTGTSHSAPAAARLPAFSLDPRLADRVLPGIVAADGLRVQPAGAAIERAFGELERRHLAGRADSQLSDIPEIRAVRQMFHALHIDPTKVRPSSEALLRRIRTGKGLYRISNAVDVCNLCSLEALVPMGLYDLGAVDGDVQLTLGGPGAGYDGIRKDRVNVENRPTLVDASGPFGAPTSDSFRTRVHEATTALYLVVFAPAGAGADRVAEMVRSAASRYEALCRVRVIERRVVSPAP